jgi:hypothetical protein|tara:strand:+ start:578 stop:2062 length:1485 start_codon:yes stop_codon:yes gene_type:complete
MGKWIGQHIFDLVAKFRSDVFLSDISSSTIASGGHLGLDSNNKIVKAQIDHDALTNFLAAEHVDWAGASAGTIHSTNIPTLNQNTTGSAATLTTARDFRVALGSTSVASFDGSANASPGVSGTLALSNGGTGQTTAQEALNALAGAVTDGRFLQGNGSNIILGAITSSDIPTLNQDTTGTAATVTGAAQTNITSLGTLTGLTVGGDLTVNGDTITFESTAANDPTVTIQNTTDDTNSPRLRFFKRREDGGTLQAGEDGDGVGEILFNSFDDNSPTPGGTNYAKIEGFIHDATNGQESGQLKLQVASHDGGVETGILLTGGSVDTEVDVTIGNGTASVTSIAGSLRPKGQIHITHHNFTADIDTTKNYVGLADADSESTSTTGIDMPLVFPMASKLLQITMRSNKNLSGLTYTFRLETQATGVGFSTGPTIVGTQSGAGPTQTGHAVYDFTTGLDSGDNLIDAFDAAYLSIQSGGSTANTKYYITCVWETDLSGY